MIRFCSWSKYTAMKRSSEGVWSKQEVQIWKTIPFLNIYIYICCCLKINLVVAVFLEGQLVIISLGVTTWLFFFSNLKWNPKTKRIWPPVIFILVHKNLLPNIPCQCEVSFESKKDAAMLLFHLFLWWYNINKQWLVHCYKYFREMPLWN